MKQPSVELTDRPKPVWCLAAYLYTNEPWEAFLTRAVLPFADMVMENQLAERWFFIRYWEYGPHIRLRFLGDQEKLEEIIRPKLVKHFEEYFRAYPTVRQDAFLPEEIRDRLVPNDSIVFVPYEPETERYGGPHAISLAEKHFEDSSAAVLSAMAASADWNYERALGVAIQLHLGFSHAVGMSRQETAAFFNFIFLGWLPRAYETLPTDTFEQVKEKEDKVLEAFRTNYELQQEVLRDYVGMVWEALEEGAEFEEEWVNAWLVNTRLVASRLEQLKQEGLLAIPETFMTESYQGQLPQGLWAIYSSYVHMTNNRLGILNRDEGYLGFLIRESIGK